MSDRPHPGDRGSHGPRRGVQAQFVLAASAAAHFPTDGLPELALVGRSNVGKSSLINAMLGLSKLARTSSTPGRTRTLNFYRIWPRGVPTGALGGVPVQGRPEPPPNLAGTAAEAARAASAFYLVDMPGYGFAKVSKQMKEAWSRLIESYLSQRTALRGVIQIIDFRHEPTRDDIQMWEWLRHFEIPRLVVATKTDKIGRSHWIKHQRQIQQSLGLGQEETMLLFSAETGWGRDQVWNWVLERVDAG